MALNWTFLDQGMDQLNGEGLYPGFEVMGNPNGSLFTDFHDPAQLSAWGDMMTALSTRYIARYGLDNVRQWRFESWNGECVRACERGCISEWEWVPVRV